MEETKKPTVIHVFDIDTANNGKRSVEVVVTEAKRSVKEQKQKVDKDGVPVYDNAGKPVMIEVDVYPKMVQINRDGWGLKDYIEVYGGEANVLSVLDTDMRNAGNKFTRAATTDKEGLNETLAAQLLEKWLREDAGASIKELTEALEAVDKELAPYEPKMEKVLNGEENPETGMPYTILELLTREEYTTFKALFSQRKSLKLDIEARRRKPKSTPAAA